ncbi:hypothetical protein PVAP13_2KG214058 [Panicum virgatum]|uniref:Uncharacterized protein n=1 Tax=Panicum virgatum TaxID=38727 RepID=A0A8T0W474_PANVG|nr:hypothetical protein PVAP13_2KG214058 [Panicum virgatum]
MVPRHCSRALLLACMHAPPATRPAACAPPGLPQLCTRYGRAQQVLRRPGDRDFHSWVFIFSAVGDMLLKLGSRCLRLVTAKAVCVEPHPSRQDGDFSLCVSTCSTMERICSCEKVTAISSFTASSLAGHVLIIFQRDMLL